MTAPIPILRWLLAAFLLLDGIASVSIGAVRLAHGRYPSGADIHLRWIEERNVAHGRDPATVSEDAAPPYVPSSNIHDGMMVSSWYPPWAFTTAFIFVPPVSWTAERWIFLGWCLAALGVLSLWTRVQFRPCGDYAARVAVLVPPALWSVSYCLSNGQYAIVIAGLLAGSFLLVERDRDAWAGVLAGIALLKPTLVAPFLLIFLLRGRWTVLFVAAAVDLVATLVTWRLTHLDPLTLIHESADHLKHSAVNSQNVVSFAVLAVSGGPNPALDFAATVTLGLLGAAVMFVAHRRGCGLATLAGIAAATSLSWTYRKDYDVVLIVFLVAATARVAMETRRLLPWLSLVVMCFVLMLPFRLQDHNQPWLQGLELLSWIIAAVACVRGDASREPA
jgi:hypothetical protein